jgi:hypothetical protein
MTGSAGTDNGERFLMKVNISSLLFSADSACEILNA